jgi:uncharacterized protein
MNNQVRQVQVRAVLPLEGSFALFLGNDEKTFVIYVDEQVGGAISMFMRGTTKERPLTHDLMASVLMAFGAKVERVVINDVNGSVFYARLILAAENELHKKLVELDARPSDSVAMAVQQEAPIYVADSVWESVDDVTQALNQLEARELAQANQPLADEASPGHEELDVFGLDSDDDDDADDDEDDFEDDEEDDDFDAEFGDEFEEDDDEDDDDEFDDLEDDDDEFDDEEDEDSNDADKRR